MNQFRSSRSGAILIEFAFSVPVFLALIYYAHDLPKMKRWQRKMDFVAKQIAQGIQTISQNRPNTQRKITATDLKHVFYMSFLSIFPGTSMLPTSNCACRYGYFAVTQIIFVRGTENNKAQIIWQKDLIADPSTYFNSPSGIVWRSQNNISVIKTSEDILKVCPNFKISNGEEKIILDVCLWYEDGSYYHFSDGTPTGSVSPRKAFGFLFYNPIHPESVKCTYFHQFVVFTPRSGLFNDTPPQ